jgi:predicted DNA-binding protein YlxM (UPF0122 family)
MDIIKELRKVEDPFLREYADKLELYAGYLEKGEITEKVFTSYVEDASSLLELFALKTEAEQKILLQSIADNLKELAAKGGAALLKALLG